MNGLYRAEFVSGVNYGSGTVYLENGSIKGGDTIIAYVGTYEITGSSIVGRISLIKHGIGNSIFGPATEIALKGSFDGKVISGIGEVPNTPVQAKVVLTKIMDLQY